MTQKLLLAAALVLLALCVLAAGVTAILAGAAWVRARGAATPTAEALADCFWSADAFAWHDVDGDGTRDEGEPPLEDVAINFDLTFFSGAATAADGTAHVGGMTPGPCVPDLTINLVAQVPQGYVATTPTVVEYGERTGRYEFGFRMGP